MDNKSIEWLAREKVFEAILSYTGACHIEGLAHDIDDILKDKIDNPLQRDLDRNVKRSINIFKMKINYYKVLKVIKGSVTKAAVIIIAILLMSTILISTVDAFRVMFFNLVIETSKGYSKITTQETKNNFSEITKTLMQNKELANYFIPTYIPKEFKVEDIQKHEDTIIIIFKDANKNTIILEQSYNIDKEYRVDTEDAFITNILVLGHKAILIEKNNITSLIWNDGTMILNLFGTIKEEELIKIAESLLLNK